MANKITVSVLNRSNKNVVTDSVLDDFVHTALQRQVSDDFLPYWKVDAEVMFVEQPIKDSWWLVILDDTGQDGWFGYHLTSDGFPLGKVFAQTVKNANCAWTVTASHELLEMLADPDDNRMISDRPFDPQHLPKAGEKVACFYALEVCDPCASNDHAYVKAGYKVSDFILPAWYARGAPARKLVDYNAKLQGPFTLGQGGYAGVYNNVDGWQLLGRENLSPEQRKLVEGGRIWTRTQPRAAWPTVPPNAI